jgi:two-component system CheB/CheR fusion protein
MDSKNRPNPSRKTAAQTEVDLLVEKSVADSPNSLPTEAHEASPRSRFPVVGIVASAGGLNAFKKFLAAMPEDSGFAVILVPHLDPAHKSMMVSLLTRQTKLPVCEAEDGMVVQPDHVYVIPANKSLSINDGVLKLDLPPQAAHVEATIDAFLKSLARDQQEFAIGIVLSGTGTSGTMGVKEIKLAGGLAIAQQPESAEFDQMPKNAIATGLVDAVLPPEEMPSAIASFIRQPWLTHLQRIDEEPLDKTADLNEILSLLQGQTRYDFRPYRRNMILRRVLRRMGLHEIQTLADYLRYLNENPSEMASLCNDLLIGVTAFFRDPEVYQDLEVQVIAPLVRRFLSPISQRKTSKAGSPSAESPCNDAEPIRVWVTGCATGEEAYSIAILLFESFAAQKLTPNFQIFATDFSEKSLEAAREGAYSEASIKEVGPERLKQFFVRVDEHHYRVNKTLRESIVFAVHNLISDTPFSRLDLISCRNLLIYLEPEVQRKIISLFHFALRLDGHLMLGTSETVGRAQDLFTPVSKKSRIFRRIGPRRHDLMELPIATGSRSEPALPTTRRSLRSASSVVETLNRLLLKKYAPAAVLMTRRYEVLSMQGPLVEFLEFPSGEPTRDLLAMARHGLTAKIRAAVHAAIRSGQVTSNDEANLNREGKYVRCRIIVTPLDDIKDAEGLLLVTFEELSSRSSEQVPIVEPTAERGDSSVIEQLQHELKAISEDLLCTIEELEHSNEELRVSQEETLSMNEELQSSNEELESSKEELQSLNEELSTANSQLQEKVEELDRANCDITNLMNSAEIATLFLDDHLCIQRFSPPAARLLNLRETDAGRPFRDLAPPLRDDSLLADCRHVLGSATPAEKEVWSDETAVLNRSSSCNFDSTVAASRCFLRRISPYKSEDHQYGGVVVTFVDITSRFNSESEARMLATVLRDSNDAVLLFDSDGRMAAWNLGAAHMYGYSEAEALQKNIMELIPAKHQEKMRIAIEKVQQRHRTNSFESQRVAKDGRVIDVWVTITAISGPRIHSGMVATTERDITSSMNGDAAAMSLTTLRSAEHYKVAEELQAILDATVDAVITINSQGVIVRVNKATERMLGYSKAEAVGQNVNLFMTSPDREHHDQYLRQYLETGVPHIIGNGREVCCLRKDGSTFNAELSVSEVDHLGLFTGMIRDVSERRRLQNEILRAVSEEQRRIGQDLHDSAGQELTGLNYLIQGHLSLLERSLAQTLSSAESTALLQSELEAMRKSTTVVKSLQQKIRSVIRGLTPVDINGRGLMAALMDLAAGISDLHHVQCRFHCPEPLLIQDNESAIHLYRIAQESVTNAIRHGGGSQIEISLTAAENNAVLTITDNGCGFDYRTSIEKSGFGLHIMNYRASLIGANLSIGPADGHGTIVRCSLPRSTGAATEGSAP